MITSPPSATAGSILYMPLPAVHTSAYIGGITEHTVFIGLSSQTTCSCDEKPGRLFPPVAGVAEIQSRGAVLGDDERCARRRHRDHRRRAIDDRAHRRVA